jgi:signal transduction histidine kinase
LLFPVVGLLIATRRPENSIAWLCLGIGVAGALSTLADSYSQWALARDPTSTLPAAVSALTTWLWIPTVAVPTTFLLLLFPDGHLPSPRWRWFARILGAAMVAGSIGIAFAAGELEGFPGVASPVGVPALEVFSVGLFVIPVGVIGSVASLVIRFRHADPVERQQIRWLAIAAAAVGILYAGIIVISFAGTWETDPRWLQILQTVSLMSFGLIPVAIGISILSYHLYDLDLVVRKTLLVAVLASFVTVVYVAVVVGIGALAGSASNTALSAAAAALVALAFQPLRRRAQRIADGFVYGERATPYEVLTEFGDRLAGTYAADDVLPRTAKILGEGLGARHTRVWLVEGGHLRPVAAWSPSDGAADPTSLDDQADDLRVDVRHQGELLGALSVAMPANDPMDPAKEKLVNDLARQAGLLLRNVRLVEDLRASRRRLVSAQDEERRRLERNIHDGAQQQLVALAVKARLARQLTDRDPAKAVEMLEQIEHETQATLQDLRDLARGIYPPLLADRGLEAAVEAQVRKAATPVTMRAEKIGRFEPEVEAAAYFSILEALQNVAKYAGEASATVRLSVEAAGLVFEVRDDGVGFDPEATARGTGLQGIADRLGALDGSVSIVSAPGEGTTVIGRLPGNRVPSPLAPEASIPSDEVVSEREVVG